jgi:hypothetical protein
MPIRAADSALVPETYVGVEQWIPLEREKWSYTPGDSILSNRKMGGCRHESAAPSSRP